MRRSLRLLALLLFSALPAVSADFSPQRLREIDTTIERAITEQQIPGGVFWLERDGEIYSKAYGRRSVEPESEPMTLDTIFDAASLTKVMATAPAVMILVEEGRIDLDSPVLRYLPEFSGNGREAVTVRQLLTHTSGLRPGLVATEWTGYARGIELAAAELPLQTPGTNFVYSDINYLLLGEIVRRVSGEPLHAFAQRRIYRPLQMKDTGFLPPESKRARIAPTERFEGEGILRGRVHDPTSRRMDGVAGSAGLFTTAQDLARYARMLLGEGKLDNIRVLKPETIQLMTAVNTPTALRVRRGLGWDLDSPYSRPRGNMFPLGSFGHTGWTGTFVWIDPHSDTFYLFLSNRVHPDGKGDVIAMQRVLGTLAAEAVTGVDFASYKGIGPRTPLGTLNGIDVLVAEKFATLQGLKIGLITNHTGRSRQGASTIDLLHNAPGVKLVALFSPEHGIRGDRDEKVSDDRDSRTGLPIFSLYGEARKPKLEQLEGLDALVFDVQDIGARFYTYISTMGLAMEAAGEAKIRFFVLDRINPITGQFVEGPLREGEGSFIAWHPIVVRHGMTIGELAQMFKAERNIPVDLTVIKLQKWVRGAWQDETGIPWINPSPNMRSLNAATLYPGVCLLERTEFSVGRGTETPFEVIGAPYVNEKALADAMESAVLPGIRFEPVRFTPNASVFKGESCGGVRMRITNRDALRPVDLGIVLAQTLHRLYPEHFSVGKVDDLLRHPPTIEAIRADRNLSAIRRIWSAGPADFMKRRERFLLY